MNFHDSERIKGLLVHKGYSEAQNPESADLIIFNTCSIRKKPEEKLFSALGRLKALKRRKPHLKIAVCGCLAQQEGENILKRAPHVDYIFGPQNIGKLKEILSFDKKIDINENPELPYEELPTLREDSVRASVNIMYGCNNFCSYCVVPYTRGREVSRPVKSILDEIRLLAENGYKEIVLLGQNVNSYDGEIDFPDLLKEVNKIEDIKRIRFITSHPKDFSEKLIRYIAELDKVCEHIHLPLQSGSDRILMLMNRGYTYSDYLKKVELLKKYVPDIAITTDIIAGFPTETDEDHKLTINALKDIEYDGIFAFKYSPRPNTVASRMDCQIPEEIKGERLKEILRLQDEISLKKNKLLEGTIQEVLIETMENYMSKGKTRGNKIVYINGNYSAGEIMNVLIEKAHIHNLYGSRV